MSRFSGLDISEHPRAIALVVCDRIILDERTKKRSLVDVFDSVFVPNLPAMLMRIGIYVAVAKGSDETSELYLGLFAPNGQSVLQSVLNVTDWGQGQAEFDLTLEGMLIAEEGTYDLRLFVNGAVLAQRSITVRKLQPPPEEAIDSPTS